MNNEHEDSIRRVVVDATQRPKVMSAADGDESVRQALAEAMASGDTDRVESWRKGFISSNPDYRDDADSLRYVGTSLRFERRFHEAREHLERAVEEYRRQDTQAGLAIALNQLAWVRVADGDHGGAWQCLDEAVSAFPAGMYGVHHNRLVLASLERDEGKASKVYYEMNSMFPAWSEDTEFIDHLKSDSELVFLRSTPLWSEIRNQFMEDADDA